MQETWVQFLGQEDPLEKEMATHSSFLAWRIPWQRSLVGYIPWVHKELDMTKLLTLMRNKLEGNCNILKRSICSSL